MTSLYNLVKSYVYSMDEEETFLRDEVHKKKMDIPNNHNVMQTHLNALDSHGALILLGKDMISAFVNHIYNITSRKGRVTDAYEISPYDIDSSSMPITTFNTYWNLSKPNSDKLSRELEIVSTEPSSYLVYVYSLPCDAQTITKSHECFDHKYLRFQFKLFI